MARADANEARIFERILCGVDGTPQSLTAVQQAARLQDPDGRLQIAAAADFAKAAQAGIGAPRAAELLEREAEAALAAARAVAPAADHKLLDGNPAAVLLHEAEGEQATLVAVGSHGRGRVAGRLLGTVAARMLHDAPCSVLVARAARDPETWPQSVVAGVDGSAQSADALAVARSIAERFAGTLDQLEEEPARAVDALTAASDSADLVVVGSRGLHGLKSLGSVSERVAHRASSSVLVVRAVPSS
ncbi:MAG TPA: universal stress protein [Gaiellaceae bacterium]|nr:universal stress protein [Gaiellaceae bacterium]